MPRCALLVFIFVLLVACGGEVVPLDALSGDSALSSELARAAEEYDVPVALLAAVGWVDTRLSAPPPESTAGDDRRAPDAESVHGPEVVGVMGLPREGRVRSVARAVRLTGTSAEDIARDRRENVRAASALLRALADEDGPPRLRGRDWAEDRDRWLAVVERYFDAGATGRRLAAEVERTLRDGFRTTDSQGASLALRASGLETVYGRSVSALAGEYPRSTWVPASTDNYRDAQRTAAEIDLIVIHTVEGSYSSAISWFQNPAARVSAHYVVRAADGDITQMVAASDIAWHAGRRDFNARSIGIEHEGFVRDPRAYTEVMLNASALLVRWLSAEFGVPLDRNHVVGHVELPGTTHTDPGRHWDWDGFMARVHAPDPVATGRLRGFVSAGEDTSLRLPNAELSISPGEMSRRTDDRGYFQVELVPGTYTITARAAGRTERRIDRVVVAGQDVWGSIALDRAPEVTRALEPSPDGERTLDAELRGASEGAVAWRAPVIPSASSTTDPGLSETTPEDLDDVRSAGCRDVPDAPRGSARTAPGLLFALLALRWASARGRAAPSSVWPRRAGERRRVPFGLGARASGAEFRLGSARGRAAPSSVWPRRAGERRRVPFGLGARASGAEPIKTAGSALQIHFFLAFAAGFSAAGFSVVGAGFAAADSAACFAATASAGPPCAMVGPATVGAGGELTSAFVDDVEVGVVSPPFAGSPASVFRVEATHRSRRSPSLVISLARVFNASAAVPAVSPAASAPNFQNCFESDDHSSFSLVFS